MGPMGERPLDVYKVDDKGRVYLPQMVRDRYKGHQLAMYEPEAGKIVMELVEVGN